ncbi:MAG: YgiT-type zinc finger protein [Prochlorotrichaceae cyanobacterium]
MFNYQCEYCDGTVQTRTIEREAFKYLNRFVILENVVVGICDKCKNRYYSAETLHAVNEVATGAKLAQKTESIPVLHL